jgi:DNA-binding winged helix-turn-helix (wHTH) protein/TolB-like protein/Tfp pilus assembly protein PilF
MEGVENNGVIYEFGDFVLDPDNRTLSKNGNPVHLPAKEFDTLLLFVRNNGRSLSKEEMISAIWDDSFVEEGNLAKQISKLRKILTIGDKSLIETIPKYGYRFDTELRSIDVAEREAIIAKRHTVRRLTLVVDEAGKPPQEPPSLSAGSRRLNLRGLVLLFSVLAASGVIFGIWYKSRSVPIQPSDIKTIAVLPMRSLTPAEDVDALGLGLTDSLITELGSVKHLVVRPIAAVRGMANSNEDALELGRKLNVDAVLDGTIQQAGGRLRINARLISTINGEQLWAEKFDDNFTSLFEVQDRISEQAAHALTAMLSGRPPSPAGSRLTKRYTENPAAFDAYWKGRYHWNKRNEADFRQAIAYFQKAVESDPSYALAYAGLADTQILLAVWGTEPPAVSMGEAKKAALKALEIDPELAEARTSLAFIKWVFDWDFPGADIEFTRALELNPNYATAHHWQAYYLVSMGRRDEAIGAINRAKELEGPLSLSIMTDVGEIFSWAREYDEAIRYLTDVIRLEPNYAVAHYELGIAYLKTNDGAEAIRELEQARSLEDSPRIVAVLAFAYGASGHPDKARELISKLETDSARRYVSPFSIAIAYTGLEEQEKAIYWLEKAYAEKSDAMAILKVHPLLLGLHSNPRFNKLASDVGYPE